MIIHGRTHSNNYIRFLRHHSPPFLLRDAMLVQYLLSSCVCPSQARIVSKRLDESSWVVICRPPFTYSTLLCKEIGYLQKIWVLPSGTLSQTLDLENFSTASQSRCQQKSFTVELVNDGRRIVAVQCLLHVGQP